MFFARSPGADLGFLGFNFLNFVITCLTLLTFTLGFSLKAHFGVHFPFVLHKGPLKHKKHKASTTPGSNSLLFSPHGPLMGGLAWNGEDSKGGMDVAWMGWTVCS